MRFSRSIPVILLAIAPLAGAAPGLATDKDPAYEIEVLVFENKSNEGQAEELFAEGTGTSIRGLEKAILAEPATGPAYLKTVVAPALEKDGNYRLLSYSHWQQTVDNNPKSSARPVRIAATNAAELEGMVRFYMSRFLHLDVKLLFRPQSTEGTALAHYRISEQRRIKTQETSYFDHPRFGVLIRVNLADSPDDAAKSPAK